MELINNTQQIVKRMRLQMLSPQADRITGSPSLKFVLRDLYIYKDFVWELLDRVIYKTLYGNPLDKSISQKYMILL